MDFKFSKDSGDSQVEAPDEKKKQSALVLLLLILIGGFTYVYFFTGLIKPQEAQKAAEAPVVAAPSVKMPLPPRDGEELKPAEKAAVASDVPKAAVPAAKPTPAPTPAPAKPAAAVAPVAKPAPAPPPPKAKEEPKAAVAVNPSAKKPLPVSGAEKKSAPTVVPKVEAKKTTDADKMKGSAKAATPKPATNGPEKAAAAVKTRTAATGPWSVMVDSYIVEENLSADMGRVRKSGFDPIVKPAARKKTTMNRLFVSEFSDRASAQTTLEKLKRLTSDGFVIEQGGKFVVYAGSYLHGSAANSEKDRLKAAGIVTNLKPFEIAVPSQSLSIGPFNSKKAAEAARGKLKNAGLKATLSQP